MLSTKLKWVIVAVLALSACSKEDDESPSPAPNLIDLFVSVDHVVDGKNLVFNSLDYTNAAGNQYKVSRLEYYLSDFTFVRSDGSLYKPKFQPVLINAENSTNNFYIKMVQGAYTGFSFIIGIPDDDNYTGALDNTLENVNMAWPEAMGGGYHFMKFEGNYRDDVNIERGFTVHLGKNGMQSVNEFLNNSITISKMEVLGFALQMNLNEWFENPHVFDFNKDGNYTMGVDSLMKKVSDNGQHCFSYFEMIQ
jgi:hypothetical protein